MDDYYRRYNANIHRGVHTLAEEATAAYEGARRKVGRFINAYSPREVVFVRNTTEAINLVAFTWGRANVGQGDVIILSVMEHHSNLVPWQLLAQATGARLEFIGLDPQGRLAPGGSGPAAGRVRRAGQAGGHQWHVQRAGYHQSGSRGLPASARGRGPVPGRWRAERAPPAC